MSESVGWSPGLWRRAHRVLGAVVEWAFPPRPARGIMVSRVRDWWDVRATNLASYCNHFSTLKALRGGKRGFRTGKSPRGWPDRGSATSAPVVPENPGAARRAGRKHVRKDETLIVNSPSDGAFVPSFTMNVPSNGAFVPSFTTNVPSDGAFVPALATNSRSNGASVPEFTTNVPSNGASEPTAKAKKHVLSVRTGFLAAAVPLLHALDHPNRAEHQLALPEQGMHQPETPNFGVTPHGSPPSLLHQAKSLVFGRCPGTLVKARVSMNTRFPQRVARSQTGERP